MGEGREHRLDDTIGRFADQGQFVRSLDGSKPLQWQVRVDDLAVGQSRSQCIHRICGKERKLNSDSGFRRHDAPDVIDREIRGVQRAPGSCFNRRAPESAVFYLRVLHRVAHVDRTVRTPLWIDDDREITRNSDRIELIKEEKTITTEHVLNIVLRRDK
jgi:hypothetical protein